MRLPRSVIEDYTKALGRIESASAKAVSLLLESVDWSDISSSRESIESSYVSVCGMSASAAAELAASFYDTIRESSVGERLGAEPFSEHDPAATGGYLRAAVQQAVDGRPDTVDRLLAQRASYEIKRAAGSTVMKNSVADPKRVKFARVPTGSETCDFCLMLASRGFVYATEKSAGEGSHFHANCDCRIVPSFSDGDTIEGYNPDALYEEWKLKSAKKDKQRVVDIDVENTLRDYTAGKYEGIVGAADLLFSDGSIWSTQTQHLTMSDFKSDELANARTIRQLIFNQRNDPATVVRTEVHLGRQVDANAPGRSTRFGQRPEVGSTITFGIKSASTDVDFAEKIARNEVPGMGHYFNAMSSNGEVLAYRCKRAERYLDIANYSDYDQSEVLISGSYRVTAVTETFVDAVDDTKLVDTLVTPYEYAKRNNLEVEFFVSKKGKDMLRVGNRTYPASYESKECISVGYGHPTVPVKVVYVDLEEI